MRTLTAVGMVVVTLFCMFFLACQDNSQQIESREWLAKRADQFYNIYKVAYNRVAMIPQTPHPCERGHKAEEAALYHATLQLLHENYSSFQSDVKKHLGNAANKDVPCKDLLSEITRASLPFAEASTLTKCGKLDATAAKTQFYLERPDAISKAVSVLRSRFEEE